MAGVVEGADGAGEVVSCGWGWNEVSFLLGVKEKLVDKVGALASLRWVKEKEVEGLVSWAGRGVSVALYSGVRLSHLLARSSWCRA